MGKSPIPLRDVLSYLKLEDVERLVPGSVKYVGHTAHKDRVRHYWSFPLNGRIRWACLDGDTLGEAERVPLAIRAKTLSLREHRVQRLPVPPESPWQGADLSASALPKWVPTNKVAQIDAEYVAAFMYDFDKAAEVFRAKPATDKKNGGAGPCRYFFLELSRNRLAMLECEARFPARIDLYLPGKEGRVFWEDYDQIMNALGVPLEEAFRQGGLNWKHRKPTPEALARTRNHYQRMSYDAVGGPPEPA